MSSKGSLLERYRASMLLHSAGDCMGYHNNKWEFNFVGKDIHQDLEKLGGIDNLKLDKKSWRASDDTVLHLANAECLIQNKNLSPSSELYLKLIPHYKKAMQDMKDRAPGNTTMKAVSQLSQFKENGYQISFNPRGGGCGASMRSSCIGLRYSKPEQLNELIEFSIESGRMTHHHPIGYLGGLAAALMVSYAIQEIPIKKWGAKCLTDFELAKKYISKSNYCVEDNIKEWPNFVNFWQNYLKLRNIESGNDDPVFPEKYGVEERDKAYKTFINSKWAGAAGIDSVLIAYDALLGCKESWEELCKRAMLHGGDNDSTGCLAGSFYGALFGFKGVNENNYKNLEFVKRLLECGDELYKIQYE